MDRRRAPPSLTLEDPPLPGCAYFIVPYYD
jgi:hypothetical protein